jgi:hypothetical protein
MGPTCKRLFIVTWATVSRHLDSNRILVKHVKFIHDNMHVDSDLGGNLKAGVSSALEQETGIRQCEAKMK